MIPCVDDAASHMLPLRRRLLNARGLSDIDRKLALGPGVVDIPSGGGFNRHIHSI